MPAAKQTFGTMVKKVVERTTVTRPASGIVYRIDGDRIDVRIGVSQTVLRHVQVLGSIDSIRVGQEVFLRWEKGRPVAVMSSDNLAISSTPSTVIVPDNDTLEHSSSGLRVKDAGIDMRHLSFTPSVSGHKHLDDPFSQAGWQVSEEGTIWKGRTFLHPTGQISLGNDDDIIKLDSYDDEWRLWVGNSDPLLADFAVGVDGSVRLTAGSIGGVDINENDVTAGDMVLTGSGVYLAGVELLGGSNPSDGDVMTISGSTATWEPVTSPRITVLFSVSGSAALIDPIPLRVYNKSGATKTIQEVFLAVNEPPSGDDLIVDIHLDGVTIFTDQDKRPVILDGEYTGTSIDIDVGAFDDGSYLQAAVDSIGSGNAGTDLTIHVIYQ